MKLKDNIIVILRLEGRPMWVDEIRDRLPPHSTSEFFEALREINKGKSHELGQMCFRTLK